MWLLFLTFLLYFLKSTFPLLRCNNDINNKNLYSTSKLQSIFLNSDINNTVTLIAHTPNGHSKKIVVKVSQLKLIKREDFETTLTEVKQENVVPHTLSTEDDIKVVEGLNVGPVKSSYSKIETKNLQIDRRYVMLNSYLKDQIKESYFKELLETENKRSEVYTCQICEKQFNSTSKYQKHTVSHSLEHHTCSFCGKIFKNAATVQRHENTHKGLRFSCDYCNRELASKQQLNVHIRRHTGEYSHKCNECDKEYYNRKAFRQHIESEHEGIRYTCVICGSVLRSRRYWKDHMTKHTDTNVKRYLCPVCNKFYSSKAALNGHMKIHGEERFECNVCGKKSIQKAAHLVHMRLHTGKKDFICEICGKEFVRKDMMQIHKRRIHDIFKYQCKYCQQKFKVEHHLLIHLHSHEEVQKKFPCEFCSKKFIDINFLRNHVNTVHVENRNGNTTIKNLRKKNQTCEKIQCLHCNKYFLKSCMKLHQVTHDYNNKKLNLEANSVSTILL